MIGLAVGKKAVVYDPEGGTTCSEDLMKVYFGDDLAFKRKSRLRARRILSWMAS
jgi:hypothetical protein